jgi:hypothetical protein
MNTRFLLIISIVGCLGTVGSIHAQQPTTGALRGAVYTVDSAGAKSFVAGALVSIKSASLSQQTSTNETGTYNFAALPPDTYSIDVSAPGLSASKTVEVSPGSTSELPIELAVNSVKESVTVSADAEPPVPTQSASQTVIDKSTLVNVPNKQDRVDALLPLIPGVVRGPDGLINMKGARSSQGGALVNNGNATDPVTGNVSVSLPIDVVDSVKVIANPYDPEYGRLTGAVASVETVTGRMNSFHLSVQNVLVRPRKRDGDFIGIESATPRLTFSGPIIKDKVAFTQSFEYRFVRTPVSSLPQLQRDIKYEGFNSFSQVDALLSPSQSITASFALYPHKINYLGLNTFNPQPSTPDLHERGYMATLQHRYVVGPTSLLVSQFSYQQFDVDTTANSSDPYQLLIETTTGGFFNQQRRRVNRTEWHETYRFNVNHLLGSHELKVGTDFAHSSYDGLSRFDPVNIIGVSNVAIENILFRPASPFTVRQNEIAWFVADSWRPFQRFTVDLGLRFDRDSVTDSIHPAPRAGVSLMLTKDAKTLLKGGIGVFYDRVPLNIVSFPYLPDRTVEYLDSDGQILSTVSYRNQLAGALRNPRSVGWNVELDRQLSSALLLRFGVLQRNTSRDFEVNPEPDFGILSVSNLGRSFYREFQFTGTYKIKRGTVNASYVRSNTHGNLNDFNQFFGNNPVAVIQPDASARMGFDAPNRFIAWGQWNAPFKLTIVPVIDVHTGFPYSIVDQYRAFIGERNAERFPRFKSLDMQVTRPFKLPFAHEKVKARVGFSVFNLLNHFNPRDVQNDIDSDRFGAYFNGVGRTFRGKFVMEF